MKYKSKVVLICMIGFLLLIPVGKAWTNNGTPICTKEEQQETPQLCSDGRGGAIIVWVDDRLEYDIYAQRIDSTGRSLWAGNGTTVCSSADYSQGFVQLVSDGSGGAIIVWTQSNASVYDIYAQRIDASGNQLWDQNGIPICTAPGQQLQPQLCSDGSGGAIITWQGPGNNQDIFAQRVNATGTAVWQTNGIVICNASQAQSFPKICSDGSGGAIIVWNDFRALNTDIYAQRVNGTGQIKWAINGTTICNATGNQESVRISSDNAGGVIVAWSDDRNANYDIYVQRMNALGIAQYFLNGSLVCNATNNQEYPVIAAIGNSRFIIAWRDSRDSSEVDLYAQVINVTGQRQWAMNGIVVSNANGSQQDQQICSDGFGGAVITWVDDRFDPEDDIYAQRLDSSGNPLWIANGTVICDLPGEQYNPQVILSGSNVIFVWEDYRIDLSSSDIFAFGFNFAGGSDSLLILLIIIIPVVGVVLAVFILYKRREPLS